MIKIRAITTTPCALGEGPLWDAQYQRLFWVDSYLGHLFCRDLDGTIKTWQMPCMIGSLAVINNDEILVALQNGLHRFNLSTHSLQLIHDPEPELSETRLNDGKTDRTGQFLFASMGITDRTQGWGALYRLRRDGAVERLFGDVIVGNGPCFSPSGDILYFSDGRGVILQFGYHPARGLSAPRPFFDAKAMGTACDGATVDSAGNLWTAFIGAGKIGCITPMGELKLTVNLPIPLVSSVMLGGPNLDVLFVTSISNSGNRQDKDPKSGLVFEVSGLGCKGLPEAAFTGKIPL